jgi:outer membrane receptor protein involved in Fe transport
MVLSVVQASGVLIPLAVLVLFTTTAAPAHAGQPADPAAPGAHVEGPDLGDVSDISELSLEALLNATITTASRSVERASEAPATVYVISKQDIRARGYSTLADVLKDLPGMETVEQYYSEQGTLVPVRGVVGNNKIVLLINGMRVNPPGGEELMIRDDVSVRFAEQIEVVYGPGSTLYGQDAISAVINIKTRRPGETRVEALGAYGNYSSWEGFGGLSLKLREQADTPLAVSAFVSARGSDLANLRKAYPVWYSNHEAVLGPMGITGDPVREDSGYNLFARIESSSASLQAWFRDSQRSSAEGSGEGGMKPVLYFVPESVWRDQSLVVEGQHTLRLAQTAALHSILTFNRYEVHPDSRYVFPIGAMLYYDDFKYGVGSGTTLEEKVDWTLGHSTRLMLGIVASNYDIVPKATVPMGGADPDQPIVMQAKSLRYYTVMGDLTSVQEIPRTVDLHYQQYGAYAEASHSFTSYLRLIAGIRVDTNSRYDDIPISPRGALVFNAFGDRLTLKYVFSQAYVAPAPYFAYNIFDNGQRISRGNADLEPERAMSNEFNATWQDGHLLASASAYYNRQSNLILTSQSEAQATVLGTVWAGDLANEERLLTRSANGGTSEALGFDLFARFNLQPVSAWASYSFVDFERTLETVMGPITTGLQQVSAHNVRLGVTWNIIDGLSVTPSFVYRSTPENLNPLTYNFANVGVSLKHPYELNLSVLYSPVEMLDVFVTGRNLTNHKYALRGVSGPAPQEPITIMIGLRARY